MRDYNIIVLAIHHPTSLQMWLTFAPIPDLTAQYYQVSESDVNMFSIVYFVVSMVIGLVGIIVIEYFGLKVAVSCRIVFIGYALLHLCATSVVH